MQRWIVIFIYISISSLYGADEFCSPSELKFVNSGTEFSIKLKRGKRAEIISKPCSQYIVAKEGEQVKGSFKVKCSNEPRAWVLDNFQCEVSKLKILNYGWGSGPCWNTGSCDGGFEDGQKAEKCPSSYKEVSYQTVCGNPSESSSDQILKGFYESTKMNCPSGEQMGVSLRTCELQ